MFILISLKTEIARSASGPKLQGPHAEDAMAKPYLAKFGDLITADHKVLSDNCESRNNHRYAVVVQDLATQWIQTYPCKTKTSQETQRSLQKFLEPDRLISFTTHVEMNKIVMWVILPNNADWDCFETLISREILKIQNPLLEEHCAFSEVIHLFQ